MIWFQPFCVGNIRFFFCHSSEISERNLETSGAVSLWRRCLVLIVVHLLSFQDISVFFPNQWKIDRLYFYFYLISHYFGEYEVHCSYWAQMSEQNAPLFWCISIPAAIEQQQYPKIKNKNTCYLSIPIRLNQSYPVQFKGILRTWRIIKSCSLNIT